MTIRFWLPVRALMFGARSTMAKGRSSRLRSTKWSTFNLVLSMLFMLTVVLLMLMALGIVSLPDTTDDSTPNDLSSFRRRIVERSEGLGKREKQWTEVISWEPRAFIYHNFLSKEECDYLIKLATPHMIKSTVVDSKTGKSKDSRVRTSSGMFLKRGRDKNMEKDFKFSTMKLGRNMMHILITSLMSSTPRMEANELLLF